MGEANRRKKSDPTYGQPKTGLIVSFPVEIEREGSVKIISNELDRSILRHNLLFWDKFLFPNGIVQFTLGPEADYLERAGILEIMNFNAQGTLDNIIIQNHLSAFSAMENKQPGLWAMSLGPGTLDIKTPGVVQNGGFYVELINLLPVPAMEVPLENIVRFKEKRRDELHELRLNINNIAATINKVGDVPEGLEVATHQVQTAASNAIAVSREAGFPLHLSSVKVSLDLRPLPALAAIIAGWEIGQSIEQKTMLAALAAAGGIGSAVKIGGDFGLKNMRERLGPYQYVARYHKEVF